jgi:hypothetical protein
MGVDLSQLLLLVYGKEQKMKELQLKVDLIINELNIVIDLLYKQNKTEAYNIFNKTLYMIIEFIDIIYKYREVDKNYEYNIEGLTSVLAEALKAMETEDLTMLADILNYEVVSLLKDAVNYE